MNELEELLRQLDLEFKEHSRIVRLIIDRFGMTPYTQFCISISNRTINMNRGFITLVKESNFISAAPLVRLSLDSLLRIFASIHSEFDTEEFAQKVLSGEQIRKMKFHGNNSKMLDANLVRKMADIPSLDWIQSLYDRGSAYVHFSINHIEISRSEKGGYYKTGISLNDEFVEEVEKVGAAHYMLQISKGIRYFMEDLFALNN